MDKIRLALYFALATLSYLLLLAWNNDYPPAVATPQSNNTATNAGIPSLEETGTRAISATDIPTASETPNSDIPTGISVTAPTPVPMPGEGEQAASDLEPIAVRTDTFDIRIDPIGGDIDYLALPLFQTELNDENNPFVVLDTAQSRHYVAQSGMVGLDSENGARPLYRSTSNSYSLANGETTLLVDLFTTNVQGVEITKRYTFSRNSYLIDVEFIVNNTSANTFQDKAFGQVQRGVFDDPSSGGSFSRTYLGFVSNKVDDPYEKLDFDDVDDGIEPYDNLGGWIGFSQHYFLTAWIPQEDSLNTYFLRKNNFEQYMGGYTSSLFQLAPNTTGSVKSQFYAGPKDQYALREIAPGLDLTIDYGWLWFLSKGIYWLLFQIHSVFSNFGVSIILLTVVVKAFFYKLSETQYKSMAGMRRVMPKMQQIKERYGDDKMKMQKATMDLYKKEQISPLGGCLPMLVQMPVFIALYFVLLESVELRHAPFIGWITDLSVRDPYFILPLLMGMTMFLQTKLSPTPADPMQAKMMTFMPIMMTAFFLWFPAGLVLYWLTNSALGILQQWYITRRLDAAYEAAKT